MVRSVSGGGSLSHVQESHDALALQLLLVVHLPLQLLDLLLQFVLVVHRQDLLLVHDLERDEHLVVTHQTSLLALSVTPLPLHLAQHEVISDLFLFPFHSIFY